MLKKNFIKNNIPVEPLQEAVAGDGGDEHKPEPDDQVNPLVKQVHRQGALHHVPAMCTIKPVRQTMNGSGFPLFRSDKIPRFSIDISKIFPKFPRIIFLFGNVASADAWFPHVPKFW